MTISANNPNNKTWLEVPKNSDFPIQNIPFGVFQTQDGVIRIGTRIGNTAIDLGALQQLGYFEDIALSEGAFLGDSLNEFIAHPKEIWTAVRNRIAFIFDVLNETLKARKEHCEEALFDVATIQNLLPAQIGDYTDFFSSKEHATNTGTMFRDPENALLPNWLHIPVGYHGRSSSIVVSGTEIYRPKGQTIAVDAKQPTFGASRLVDFELEMAFITTNANELGDAVAVNDAENHIFGMVLFNDWSARDIQKWEYVPLGPFLGKNFASTISPWIVTMDALEPYRVASPKQEPKPLEYLQQEGDKAFDIKLAVGITPENGQETILSNSNFKYMYWTMAQQLAHHTVNGCNVRAGDMMGSGTISGPTPDSYGSMLELAWRGTKPVKLNDGSERKFINDNDTVTMYAYCENNGVRIGFGKCEGKLLPAK